MINYNTCNNIDLVNYYNETDNTTLNGFFVDNYNGTASFDNFFDAFFGNKDTIKNNKENIIFIDYIYKEELKNQIFNKCISSDFNDNIILTDEEYDFIAKKVNEKKDKSYLKKYIKIHE